MAAAQVQVQILAENFTKYDSFSPSPPTSSRHTYYQTKKTPEKNAESSPRRGREGREKIEGQSPHDASTSSPRTASSPKGANDIFSLSDAELAARYQVCFSSSLLVLASRGSGANVSFFFGHVQFVEEIGFGNWGSVWKCRPKSSLAPSSTVAIKLVHRSKNPTSSARVRSLWTEFKCIRALRPLSHPNVIEFKEFIITPSYALITMNHHPRVMPVALPEVKAREFFRQLCDAVSFLHRHGKFFLSLRYINGN